MSESNYAQKLIQAGEMAKKEGLNVPLNVIPRAWYQQGQSYGEAVLYKPKSQLGDTAPRRPLSL